MEMTPRPDLIFDLGMHVAQDTEFYLRKGFRVVAIEANPVLARAARSRLHGAVEEGRLVVLAVGIGGTRGLNTFFIDPVHSEWSSFEPGLGGRSGEGRKVAVPTVLLGDVLREFGCPHYLKIDIEGHDLLALRQLEESGCRPSFVSVENGEPPMLETLVRMGYAGFKFINQATVPKLRLPLRAREGQRIRHRFPFGATGPFGEETPGTWRSAEDIECEIRAYWERPGRDAAVHGWYDLHARHGRLPLPNNGVLNISKWIRK